MSARTETPPLSDRDTTLLAGLLEADCSLPALAERTNTPLGDLLDWAETPAVSARIATAERLANLHAALTAPSSRSRAIAALETLLADKSNPIETRRTATAILRALNQSLRPLLAPPRIYEPSARAVDPAGGSATAPPRVRSKPFAPPPTGRPSQPVLTPLQRVEESPRRGGMPGGPSGDNAADGDSCARVRTNLPTDSPAPDPVPAQPAPGPLLRSLTVDPIASLLAPFARPVFPFPSSLVIPDHPGPIAALRAAAGAPARRPP